MLVKRVPRENVPAIIAVVLLLAGFRAVASDSGLFDSEQVAFEHVSVGDGLSQNTVDTILQDDRGFLWIGTQDGLNRFDGYSFTVYRARPDGTGLTDNVITSLFQDSSGDLWIGTMVGLNRLSRDTWSFSHFPHSPEDMRSLSNPSVQDIYEDSKGDLWIATGRGGLNLFDRQNEDFTRYRHDPDNDATLSSDWLAGIAEDPRGFLWIGTEDAGVNRFDPQTGTVERFRHVPGDPESLSDDAVTALLVDREETLWIATANGGLNRFNSDTQTFTHYRHSTTDPNSIASDNLRTVFEDSRGRLWIGHFRGGGISVLDRETGRISRQRSINDNFIRSIYEDRKGIIWIGTYVGGLSKYDPWSNRFRHYHSEPRFDDSLSDNTVRAFYRDDATLYIGTEGGMNVLDLTSGSFTHYKYDASSPGGIPHDIVRSFFPDGTRYLWVATHDGLARFDKENRSFRTYRHDPGDPHSISGNTVWRVLVDSSGFIWAGAQNALNRLDPQTGRFTRFFHDPADPHSISGDRILALYESRDERIWVSTVTRGVSVFDPDSGLFRRYDYDEHDPFSLGHPTVFSIMEDDNGHIWMGTRGGVSRLDPFTDAFTRYTEADGLPNPVVYGILADDDGSLWMSTNRGLVRFSPDDEVFVTFHPSEGVQAYEFNNGAYYRSEDGTMYFGGVNGFNSFHPEHITLSNYNPPVVVTEFRVLNEIVPMGEWRNDEVLTLSHTENYLSFEFASLDYSSADKNRYEYILEGFDSEWVDAGTRRYANYTNLPPGHFTFSVRGTNSDGAWSSEIATFPLRIVPAFYQTTWFRVMAAVAAFLLVVATYRYKTMAILRENTRLESAVEERTAQLRTTNALLEDEVAQRRRAEEEIKLIAYYDYLTSLPNRRFFVSLCEREIADCRRHDKRFCIFFIDLDNFKPINDRHGHEAGDAVLVETARRLKLAVRECDVLGRMGGDEFVLLLTDVTDRNAVEAVAAKLVAALRAAIEISPGTHLSVDASVGISCYPHDDEHLDELLTKADRAMYAVKRNKNAARVQVAFYDEISGGDEPPT